MDKSHKISVHRLLYLIRLTTLSKISSKTLKTQILDQHVLQFSFNRWVVHKLFAKALSTIWLTQRLITPSKMKKLPSLPSKSQRLIKKFKFCDKSWTR